MTSIYGQLPPTYKSISAALEDIAKTNKLPTMSGGSGHGWSYWSTLQRCPRAFFHRYVDPDPTGGETPAALDIGVAVHAFLALHYSQGDPEWLKDQLLGYREVNPEYVYEAWRLAQAYFCNYVDDYLKPIAVEQTAVDPQTGNSCRYDLIAEITNPPAGIFPGIYNVEHKTAKSFTWEILEGWDLDGEILGQVALWESAGMQSMYGDLQGVIVNVIGKQVQPSFHRAFVPIQKRLATRHLRVLDHLEQRRQEYAAQGDWPQFFAGCITRYGRCSSYRTCQVEAVE